ncbi:MAG: FeoA family protein [Thiohalomonadaceae bacterium]
MPSTQLLSNIPAHSDARVVGFAADIEEGLRERLLAYGLIPGQIVRVMAQRPLTLLQIDYTELALEKELAACVLVKKQA